MKTVRPFKMNASIRKGFTLIILAIVNNEEFLFPEATDEDLLNISTALSYLRQFEDSSELYG